MASDRSSTPGKCPPGMERSFQVHFRFDLVIIGVALPVLGQLWEPFGAPWAVLVHLLGQSLARGDWIVLGGDQSSQMW